MATVGGLPPKPPVSDGVAGLPPKPATRRQSTPNAPVNHSFSGNTTANTKPRRATTTADGSPSRRAAFQNDVTKLSVHMTASEQNFLQELIANGTDQQVETAHENLLDKEDLFTTTLDETQEKVAQAWLGGSNNTSQRSVSEGKLSVSRGGRDNDSLASINDDSVVSSVCLNPSDGAFPVLRSQGSLTDSVGSERRQEMLQQRREHNQVFDRIWQAHESGLAVTRHASQRSLTQTRGMTGPARSMSIFRRTSVSSRNGSLSSSSHHTPLHAEGIPPPRRSFRSTSERQQVVGLPRGGAAKKPSLRRMVSDSNARDGSKPNLQRLLSDSSRKSVTFARETSERTFSSGSRRAFARAGSAGSIPSIHMAHPIRSNSMASQGGASVGSFPVIPHVRAMRSSSTATGMFSSSSSTYYNNYGSSHPYDEADDGKEDEKKTDGLWPVPNKVLVRQTDDSTKYLMPSQAVTAEDGIPKPQTMTERFTSTSSEYFQDSSEAYGGDNEMDRDDPLGKQVLVPSPVSEEDNKFGRPVLMRDVSAGEGVEVADFAERAVAVPARISPVHHSKDANEQNEMMLAMANSFDETMSFHRMSTIFRRPIQRSLSDEAATAGVFVGPASFLRESVGASNKEAVPSDGDSWQMDDELEEMDYYDPWLVIEDEYENGYGGGGTLPFQIIGTSASDRSAQPHVLSPPLMESIQQFLPFEVSADNFWLKYSLVRDGASMHTFLKHARNAKSSILALETTDGEVFGAYTSESWRKSWNYFGTGQAFLWRMRHSRLEKARSIIDQAHRESELDVFPYTGENDSVQLCTNTRLAVGGGAGDLEEDETDLQASEASLKSHEWGHGLTIQGDLLQGTSSPCLTFGSPSLSVAHSDGSLFEVINLELWTLTPCLTLEEAEKLELGKMFLESYGKRE